MSNKRPVAVALAGALCLVTTACADSSTDKGAATGGKASATAAKSGYPVTLENCGCPRSSPRSPAGWS